MKLQNLAIIFLVIIIPLIMILAYYLNLQQETLKLQAEYDTKLAEATKEGVKAFEVNTVDWSEWVSLKTSVTRRENATAAINTFLNSMANNLNITGTAREYISNYVPAIAMTMYDGYYIYAPTYVPVTIEDVNARQIFLDNISGTLVLEQNSLTNTDLVPIYEPRTGAVTKNGEYTDENGSKTTIQYVTEIGNAKTEYEHTLSNQIAYSARYSNGANTKFVVNYTLDNRIYVYGKVNGTDTTKDGYLVYFDSNTALPRIYVTSNDPQNDSAIHVYNGIKDSKYGETSIEPEVLEEQVLYSESGMQNIKTFKYIYDVNNDKLYYDESIDNFFVVNGAGKERQFINNSQTIKAGDDACRYKSVSVLWGTSGNTEEYKKIYQALNGKDKGKWYISIKEDSPEAIAAGKEEIDTELRSVKLSELGLDDVRFSTIYKDFSAINYYVEAYAFTNWARNNLSGVKQEIYNETTKKYEPTTITVEGTAVDIFNITATNDLEKKNSPITLHKMEIMTNHVSSNLNLSISNYSRGAYNFQLPVLTDDDWEQAFSNISMITFFQGVPIGLKYYNNYAIATSTDNREYVDPRKTLF